MKKRKIPMRKCLGCGENKSKKDLIRIVKTTEGEIVVDTTGKVNGRGAYICNDPNCLKNAFESKSISKSLKGEVTEEIYTKLQEKINNQE